MADDLVLKLKGQTHRADKVGAEIARLDNQHADVMGRDLFSKRLGCSLQRGLGSTVQRACWQGILGGTTGDIDNGTRALGTHGRENSLEGVQRAEEVGVHLEGCFFVPAITKSEGITNHPFYLRRHVRDVLASGQDGVSSNIDQIIKATKGVYLACNAGLRLCHVQLNHRASGLLDLPNCSGGFGLIADRANNAVTCTQNVKAHFKAKAIGSTRGEPHRR